MEKYSLFPFLWGFCPIWCLQGINSCIKKGIFFVCCKNTVSMEVNAKPMGMQLKYSLCSTVFCRSYKTKYGQKTSTFVHLSQSCWLVVRQLPAGKGRQGSRQSISKGGCLLPFSTWVPTGQSFCCRSIWKRGDRFCHCMLKPHPLWNLLRSCFSLAALPHVVANLTLPRVIFPV